MLHSKASIRYFKASHPSFPRKRESRRGDAVGLAVTALNKEG